MEIVAMAIVIVLVILMVMGMEKVKVISPSEFVSYRTNLCVSVLLNTKQTVDRS